ncbi:MAG: hypothetical protein ABR517_13515 [Thermoanaerobaculia bacterium]
MKTRLLVWFLSILSLALILGCTPRATPPPTDTSTTTEPEEPEVPPPPFSDEIYVLVGTDANGFTVSPDPVYVYDRQQKVIWIAEEPNVQIAIEYAATGEHPEKPGMPVPAPAKPCEVAGRRCGGDAIGGEVGRFKYTIKGKKGAKTLPDLDPMLDILY